MPDPTNTNDVSAARQLREVLLVMGQKPTPRPVDDKIAEEQQGSNDSTSAESQKAESAADGGTP